MASTTSRSRSPYNITDTQGDNTFAYKRSPRGSSPYTASHTAIAPQAIGGSPLSTHTSPTQGARL